MKIKTALMLAVFAFASFLYPQNYASKASGKMSSYVPGSYYFENFNGAQFPPAGWQAISVLGYNAWQSYHIGSSPNNCALIYGEYSMYGSSTGLDWLITPQYTVYSGDSLSFLVGPPPYGSMLNDVLTVLVATENEFNTDGASLEAAFADTLAVINVADYAGGWGRVSFSLNQYAGQKIYIGFREYNAGGSGMRMDDVKLGIQPVTDIKAAFVDVPYITAAGRTVNISAIFINQGVTTQDFNAVCEISGGNYSETFSFTGVSADSEISVQFPAWTPAEAGIYTVKVYTNLSADENKNNDTVSSIINVARILPGKWSSETGGPGCHSSASASYIKKSSDEAKPDTSYIFIMGGYNSSSYTAEIYKYNTVNRSWTLAGASLPQAAAEFKSVQLGGKIYMPGGAGFYGISTLSIYDIEADTIGKGADLPYSLSSYVIGTYGDSLIYLIGGFLSNESTISKNVLIYNVNTDSWKYGSPFPGEPRFNAGGSICGGKIVVAGGSGTGSTRFSDTYAGIINPEDPYTITWSKADDYPGGSLTSISAGFWYGKEKKYIYFTGGSNGLTGCADTWAYNVTTDKWEGCPYKITPVQSAANMCPVVRNDSVYMAAVGGFGDFEVQAINEWLYIGHDDSYKGIDAASISASIDTIIIGTQITPTATIKNNGVNPERIITYIEITPGGYFSGDTVDALAPKAQRQVSFAPWKPEKAGLYTVKVYTYVGGDEYPDNDTLVSQAFVKTKGMNAAPFSVDFDTVTVHNIYVPKATFANKDYLPQTFLVKMEITPGEYLSVDTINNLAPYKKQHILFAPWSPDTTGIYTVKIYTYLEGDENTSDDTLVSQVVVEGKDVAPFSIDFDTIAVHAAYTPKATFENKDYLPHTFVTYMEINPGGYISADTVENAAAHAKRQVSFIPWTPDSTGIYSVKVYTYAAGDKNSSNDTLTSQILVKGKDAAPFSIDFDTIVVNAAYTPKATFENNDYLAHTFIVAMEVTPGDYISIDTVDYLAPHKKRRVSFMPWTPDSIGTYTVKVFTCLAGDENLINDTLASQIAVINQGLDVAPFSVDFDTVAVKTAFIPKATFINKQVFVQPFFITMKITPGSYVCMDIVKDLAYTEKYQVSFPEWTPDAAGIYTVKIFTALQFDENKSNDTLTKSISVTKTIGLNDAIDPIPDVYSLSQNYPNPFNPTTVIRYGLPESGNVELKIYDMLGREVQTLVSGYENAGMHEAKFNAAGMSLSSGVYIYRIKSGSFVQTKKLMLIK